MRRPNIASSATDFVFAALAFAIGLGGAPASVFVVIAALALAAWAWTRRTVLAQMPLARRLTSSALAIVMIGAVLALAYWFGLMLGGHA